MSEKLSESVLETILSGVLICNLDTKIVQANRVILEMFGYTKEEVVGRSALDFIDAGEKPRALGMIAEGLAGKIVKGARFTGITKAGEKKPIIIQGTLLKDEKNIPRQAVIFIGDQAVFEQAEQIKESEERYRMIFNSTANILVQIDRTGTIVDVNEQIKNIGGYETKDFIGRKINSLAGILTPVSIALIAANFAKRMLGFKIDPYEVEGRSKDGRPLFFEISAVPLKNTAGENVGELAILRNITETKKMGKELENAQSMLFQAEKLAALGELAGGVAHEIKNPLGIVVQGADYLEQNISKDNKDQLEVLGMIREAVQRANKIVRGLLDFSRPSQLKIEPVKIDELINYALSLIKADLDLTQVEVIHEIKTLPLIKLDKNQITQVFINLFLNSLQAMSASAKASADKPAGGKLIIRAYLRKESLVCEVEDTGQGVRKENLNRIFNPFFTTKPPGQGVGLGLSVTHAIIENHGGQISVESEEGKGTKVIIILPVSREG